MKRFEWMHVAVGVLLLGGAVRPAGADPVAALRELYEQSIERIEQAAVARGRELSDAYGNVLQTTADRSRRAGQLDDYLALESERQRFLETRQALAPGDGSPPEVVSTMRLHYREALRQSERERYRQVIDMTERYISRLQQELRQSTADNRIEEALRFRDETARVRDSVPYKQAQFELAMEQPPVSEAAGSATARATPSPAAVALPLLLEWDGAHGGGVTVISGQARSEAAFRHEGANRLTPAGLLCMGGRTVVEDVHAALLQACRSSNELTLEVHFDSRGGNQQGPARILSFSRDVQQRNVTLGQERDTLVLRLRTTQTGPNGSSPEVVLGRLPGGRRTGVVITYRPGALRVFMNGEEVAVTALRGDFSNWEDNMRLLVGNEWQDERPWEGRVARFSISSQVLEPEAALRRSRVSEARPRR